MSGYVIICVRYGRFDNDGTRCFETFEAARRDMLAQLEEERIRLLGCGWEVEEVVNENSAFIDDTHWVIREVGDV